MPALAGMFHRGNCKLDPRVVRFLGQLVVAGRDPGVLGYWNFYRRNPAVTGSYFCYCEQPNKKI